MGREEGGREGGREGGNYVVVQFYPCLIINYHMHTKANKNSQIEPQHLSFLPECLHKEKLMI